MSDPNDTPWVFFRAIEIHCKCGELHDLRQVHPGADTVTLPCKRTIRLPWPNCIAHDMYVDGGPA